MALYVLLDIIMSLSLSIVRLLFHSQSCACLLFTHRYDHMSMKRRVVIINRSQRTGWYHRYIADNYDGCHPAIQVERITRVATQWHCHYHDIVSSSSIATMFQWHATTPTRNAESLMYGTSYSGIAECVCKHPPSKKYNEEFVYWEFRSELNQSGITS